MAVKRLLRADEIESRVKKVKQAGCSILLYKTARTDMGILDERYGDLWKKTYQTINGQLFCTISVWNEEIKQWIERQDIGTESMAAQEKGKTSDAFKRAGFNWGIGRELYTAPFIWIKLKAGETKPNGNTFALSPYLKFFVTHIKYKVIENSPRIDELDIADNNGNIRYSQKNLSRKPVYQEEEPEPQKPVELIPEEEIKNFKEVLADASIITPEQALEIAAIYKKSKGCEWHQGDYDSFKLFKSFIEKKYNVTLP